MSAVAALSPERRRWSSDEIEDLVVGLLGRLLGKAPKRLRAELEALGPHMPVDSLDLFDVLVDFRRATGITLPKQKLKRHIMRSVQTFAQFAAGGQP